MNENSERRIRNNRIKRQRQLRRNICMCLFTVLLVISLSFILFSFRTRAQGSKDEIMYKYYKSIMVDEGDSLWKYAGLYGDKQYYATPDDYIKEVMSMNFLEDETIISGQYLILPYYSPEFL